MSEQVKIPIELKKIIDKHELFTDQSNQNASFANKLQVKGK